jgi:amidohydrolase
VEKVRQELIEIRHDLHRHPEVSGHEVRTAGVIAQRLRALGFEVRPGVGGHGVVGVLRGGRPGVVVAYRADIDAIATDLPDPAPFRSETAGVRHICGHDVHTAVALGIAEAMAAVREDIPGTVKLLFQPAEERGLNLFRFEAGKVDADSPGALLMIRDGALENARPAAIFALHTAPLLTGQIGATPGIALAGADRLVVRFRGAGD